MHELCLAERGNETETEHNSVSKNLSQKAKEHLSKEDLKPAQSIGDSLGFPERQ